MRIHHANPTPTVCQDGNTMYRIWILGLNPRTIIKEDKEKPTNYKLNRKYWTLSYLGFLWL